MWLLPTGALRVAASADQLAEPRSSVAWQAERTVPRRCRRCRPTRGHQQTGSGARSCAAPARRSTRCRYGVAVAGGSGAQRVARRPAVLLPVSGGEVGGAGPAPAACDLHNGRAGGGIGGLQLPVRLLQPHPAQIARDGGAVVAGECVLQSPGSHARGRGDLGYGDGLLRSGALPLVAAAAALLRRLRLAAATLLKVWLEAVAKMVVQRDRPAETLPDVILRGQSAAHGLSRPSGHAMVIFAVTALVAPYFKGW